VIRLDRLAAFNAQNLPIIRPAARPTMRRSARQRHQPGDEVTIAGVSVGKVTGVDLEGDHVRVLVPTSRESSISATASGAEIRIKTVLGAMYLRSTRLGPVNCPRTPKSR